MTQLFPSIGYAAAKPLSAPESYASRYGDCSVSSSEVATHSKGDAFISIGAVAPKPHRDSQAGLILVVEDDLVLQRILSVALGGAGYQVCLAADGESAWEQLCTNDIDLLVTDNELPLLSGLDLLRRLRHRSLHLPVVFMSGRMPWDEGDLLRLVAPGFLLEKPFTLDALLGGINRTLCPEAVLGGKPY